MRINFSILFSILFFSRHNNNYTESVLIMLDSEDIYSLNTKITIRLGNKHKDDFYSQKIKGFHSFVFKEFSWRNVLFNVDF